MKRQASIQRGFTLVETALSIVIGFVMIGGAILIFNQAKLSAGNARAQEKVSALQAIIEQYMAYSDGVPPSVEDIRALWQRARPDDYNTSPWGGIADAKNDGYSGQAGCAATPTTVQTNGILYGNCLDQAQITGTQYITNPVSAGPVPAPSTVGWNGMLLYYNFSIIPAIHPRFDIWDESRRSPVVVTSYGVATTDQTGTRWFYVKGNENGCGDSGSNVMGLSGGVGTSGGGSGC